MITTFINHHKFLLLVAVLLFVAAESGHAKQKYNRDEYGYRWYSFPQGTLGFYSNKKCKLEVDHVVALYDAHISGASSWPQAKKQKFANDRNNHLPSCSKINRSKGASGPFHFLRKSNDKKGIDFHFPKHRFCEYVQKYYEVKKQYGLIVY